MNGPIDWAAVLGGEPAFQPQAWTLREAERIRLNEPDRRRFEEEWNDESKWAIEVTESGRLAAMTPAPECAR